MFSVCIAVCCGFHCGPFCSRFVTGRRDNQFFRCTLVSNKRYVNGKMHVPNSWNQPMSPRHPPSFSGKLDTLFEFSIVLGFKFLNGFATCETLTDLWVNS